MGITFQVSLYPLMQKDIRPAINGFISKLKSDGMDAVVHETSTIGTGNIDKVFGALKNAYIEACKSGDTIMVLTAANGCPTKEELNALNKE
ncbi:MAG: YkoF family thiamine/hydroxymethylpyrimidine-binding protein [Candidatus Kryptoniota bacterium]